MTYDQLVDGMPSKTARKLRGLARPAVRLASRPARAKLTAGASRLGGAPDVAAGFAWPTWQDRPLAFLGQVNLADVAGVPGASDLPASGLLSFFYDGTQETWGFDPRDRGSWHVHFAPVVKGLKPQPAPRGADLPSFPACVLEASAVETVPPVDSTVVEERGLTKRELGAYAALVEQFEAELPEGPRHQLLGHPAAVQGDMQLECQLVSNGIYCGGPEGYADPRATALGPGASQWRLLAQLDTDDVAQMMWGDCGRLYFWMTEDALRRHAFEECWMILQCS